MLALPKSIVRQVPASFPLGSCWFVLACLSGREAGLMAETTFETYCPMETRSRVVRGRRVKTTRPLLSGYVFVRFDRELDDWGEIEHLDGSLGVLCNADIPVRVPAGAVETFRRAEAAGVFDFSNPGASFPEGSLVEVADGPFIGLLARVKSASAKKRVRIVLEEFGKLVEVDASKLVRV